MLDTDLDLEPFDWEEQLEFLYTGNSDTGCCAKLFDDIYKGSDHPNLLSTWICCASIWHLGECSWDDHEGNIYHNWPKETKVADL